MKLRRRTLRRLGAFLLMATLVGVSTYWVFGRGARRQALEVRQERTSGLALLGAGDYEGALHQLSNYLTDGEPQRVERDFAARLAHAQARLRVFESGERHVEQSARLLSDLAEDFADDPQRLEALHLLMQATAEGGDWSRLRRLCDDTLEEFPQDERSLQMRRMAAEELGDLSSALADSLQLNELLPQNVEEQLWTMRLMAWIGRPRDAIVRHAVDLTERYPHDPRFLLVLAVAYRNAEQTQQAIACLRQAAQSELPEEGRVEYVARLAGLFDAFGEHDLAREAYVDAVRRTDATHTANPMLRQLLALRLWQAGRLEEALAVVPAQARQSRQGSIELLATRILLQFEHGDAAEAAHGLAMLGRSIEAGIDDPEQRRLAIAWHEALQAAYAPASAERTARSRLEALRKAYARLRGGFSPGPMFIDEPAGLFLKWTGDLYAGVGEVEQAVRHWRAATDHMSGWDEPLLLIAETTLAHGMVDEARRAVGEATPRARNENAERAQVLRVRIAYQQWLEAPSVAGEMEAAALAAQHQRLNPLDAQTLPIHVHMTSLTNRDEARRLVNERLQVGADPSLRVELARVSQLSGLGLEEQLLLDVDDPQAALLWAGVLVSRGKSDQAMQSMQRRQQGAASGQPMEWEIARARLAQHVQPAEAAAIWRRIGAGQPQNVVIQLAILDESRTAPFDRAFLADTIERLAQITGPSGRRWRLEKARWLLADQTPAAAMDSADLLRGLIRDGSGADTIDARVMLAEALVIGANDRVAGEHLAEAFSLDRSRGDVGLRLIGALERSGRHGEADRLLGQLAAEGVRGGRQRLEVAWRLEGTGHLEAAITLLRQAARAGQLEPEGQTVLADLLTRSGKPGDAEKVYADLLSQDSPPPQAIMAAAIFLHERGRADEAGETLELLARAPLAESEREVIRATYHARIGDAATARVAFAHALRSSPAYAGPWREAVSFELSQGSAADALAIAERAIDAGVRDERLEALASQARAMMTVGGGTEIPEQLRGLATAASGAGRAAEWSGHLRAISQAALATEENRALGGLELARLEQAAVVFDQYTPLLKCIVEGYAAAGETNQAAQMARRLAEAAPLDGDAQRMAFEAYRDAKRPFEAQRYATRWRALDPGAAVGPDLALAEARLLAEDFDGVLQAIGPHLGPVSGTSGESNRLMALAAEANAALGDTDAAFDVIEPRLARSAFWRGIATRLASERVRDRQAASRWLEAVETHLDQLAEVPADTTSTATADFPRERLSLAAAWARLGSRLDSPGALERGRRLLQSLTAGPLKQDPEAWAALARAAAWSGDQAEVEAAYRRVLALDPRQAPAANQLAQLLLGVGDASIRAEALTWARVAAEQVPIEPEYQATLARAHLAVEDSAPARATFERALRLDDAHLDAMLGLATLLVRAGEIELAERWFTRLAPQYERSLPIEPHLQGEFQELSARFSSGSR